MLGRLSVVVRTFVQRLLNRAGYRIERLVVPAQPIDVFELAVRKAALERGRDFFFVQIGANDGNAFDPIRRFVEEYRWAGLLVEPQPLVFKRLQKNYAGHPQLRFVNAAIAASAETVTLYTVETDALATGMASFNRELLVKQLPLGTKVIELQVPACTLGSLLATHSVTSIDLLQIDTEGYDYEVIKMLDLTACRPEVIHYEHRHLSDADRSSCERLLAKHGYRLHVSGIDTTAIIQAAQG